jgi:hypothetical protein
MIFYQIIKPDRELKSNNFSAFENKMKVEIIKSFF